MEGDTAHHSLGLLMKGMIIAGLGIVLALPGIASAADVSASVSERYASGNAGEAPSFQRHVVPLLGRLGCNGRACHGSFQGQAGFRLSLFGYDFKADHAALTGGDAPRVDLKNPAVSLMLQKPTSATRHKGGKRFESDGWQYRLLRRWIEAGAPGHTDKDAEFAALDVEPKEIVYTGAGQTTQLKIVASWSDGAREDVTPLCRYRSNDDAIASISESGVVKALGKGDTDIIVFYDNGIFPVHVLLPVSDKVGPRYPAVPTPTRLDELIVEKLRKLGIVPSEVCTDAEFLRRVSLDIAGTLPTADEVLAFLADKSPDKRSRKIDELLERPAYAAWWATRLCDMTGNNERNGPLGGEQALNHEKSRQWYEWIQRRVRENMPYDQIVQGIVLSESRRPGQSFDAYCEEMSSYFRKDNRADFSERSTMPYFWTRRQLGKADEKALGFAHAFLGVNLQCAQCHKHPYDQWTKQDFEQFSAFFNGMRYGAAGKDRTKQMLQTAGLAGLDEDSGKYKRMFVDLLAQGKVLPFKELTIPVPRPVKPGAKPNPKAGRVITPKLLGGDEVVAERYSDSRQPLMDWVRQEDHPYFASAMVNRVWAAYFHVGLIDPPDDHNLANPPSNPAVLDYLSHEFVNHDYDMKWLHRTIANSRTYQLSWKPNDTNKHDERNFSRAVIRRLPAEVAYDAVVHATASDEGLKKLQADPINTRAIGVSSGFAGGREPGQYAVNLFGAPARTINCDCERSNEPSLLQTVYLRNDQEVLGLLDRNDGWLRQLVGGAMPAAKGKAPAKKGKAAAAAPAGKPGSVRGSIATETQELVRLAYLRTLSRPPEEREAELALKHLQEAPDLVAGTRDLLWALINTKEFLVNR